ncbi:MAG: hypothetical protein HOJ04_00475 [Lentimicrobiaceae bacterium]|jgi:hypothetical protein|nr:hypothetical protein [Lentimicrobiaceae bacterium]
MFWNAIEQFLFKRLVYPSSWWVQALVSIIFGVFVFGFLGFYTPFNLNELNESRYLPASVYGFISAMVIFMTLLLAPLIAKNKFSGNHFNNLNMFILFAVTLVLINLFNYLYTRYGGYSEVISIDTANFSVLSMDVIYFPALLIANLVDWQTKKLIIVELPFLEKQTHVEDLEVAGKYFSLENTAGKVVLEIQIKDFICAFSNQNYSDVFILNNGKSEKLLLRIPFSKLFEQLEACPQIIRCHRTRIANLSYATGLIDDEGKTLIKLKYVDEAIPVSRRYPIEDHCPGWQQAREG